MLQSDTAGLRCLSCEHENEVGAKFCAECGSRLNLKLCNGCEAINDADAQSCHNCGADFAAARVLAETQELKILDEIYAAAPETAGTGKSIRVYDAVLSSEIPVRAPIKRAGIFASAVLLIAALAGAGYYLYRPGRTEPASAPSTESAPVEQASTASHGATQTGRIEPAPIPRVAEPPKPQPVPAVRPVTHTAASAAAPAATEVKPKPVRTARPARTVSTEVAPEPVNAAPSSVTHTKGFVAPPIVAAGEVKQPAVREVKQEQAGSSACTQAVIALGLCTQNAKGEGK